MKIAILGTGAVGQNLASKLRELGHEVYMATRNPEDTKARTEANPMSGSSFQDWYVNNQHVHVVAYGDLPKDADMVLNATSGQHSLDALNAVGTDKLSGKTILDLANPLDFSQGMPPTLTVCNTDSLGEQIQLAFPESKVVKSLNTVNFGLMTNPSLVPEDHNLFVSGNDESSKKQVIDLLAQLGWQKQNILDLGDIKTARGTEMMLPFWINLMGKFGTPLFNFKLVKNQ